MFDGRSLSFGLTLTKRYYLGLHGDLMTNSNTLDMNWGVCSIMGWIWVLSWIMEWIHFSDHGVEHFWICLGRYIVSGCED